MKTLAALAAVVVIGVPCRTLAFVRAHVDSDFSSPALSWCEDKPSYVINESGSRDAGPGSLDAVRASFQTWTEPACTGLTFDDRGTTSRIDVGYDLASDDNINLVVWREVSCVQAAPSSDPCLQNGGCSNKYGCWEHSAETIALTITTYDNRTGDLLDADIELNGVGFVFTISDGPTCPAPPPRPAPSCAATDVRNTVTHEIGHVIGLAHTPVADATMFASASLGETSKRILAQDDIDGLCTIYPKSHPFRVCGSFVSSRCGCATMQGPVGVMFAALLVLASRARRLRHSGEASR